MARNRSTEPLPAQALSGIGSCARQPAMSLDPEAKPGAGRPVVRR